LPATAAAAYGALGRYDDALAASDRAIARASAPQRVALLAARGSLLVKKGDRAAGRRAYQEAVALAESLPRTKSSEKTVAGLKAAIERIDMLAATPGSGSPSAVKR